MKKIRLLILALIVILTLLFPTSTGVAFAATSVYSDVLADLQVDESFNVDDYPINQTDFSLNLITVAESNDKSLLVYVYQPSAGKNDVLAKKIRMSVDDGQSFHDYDLTLLSKNGVFFKYKVDNYTADSSSSVKRTYQIIELLRFADANLGDTVIDENNNTITYIEYPVGWTFTAVMNDGVLCYGKSKIDYSVVTNKYCGQLLFNNPSNSLTQYCYGVTYGMLHFIAFDGVGLVDQDGKQVTVEIEKMQEADVEYTLVHYEKDYSVHLGIEDGANYERETSERIPKTLNAEVSDTYKAGLFAHTYSWNEIMPMANFLAMAENDEPFFNSSLTEVARSEFSDMQFVLILGVTEIRYTNVSIDNGLGYHETDSRYYVNDETIMRIQFETDGKVYNLGTVDNYQHGDSVPDNTEDYGFNEEWWSNWWQEMQEWLKYILIFLGCVVLGIIFVLIFPFIKAIFSIIWAGIKVVFRVITAPFRFLFGSKNKRR